MRIVVVGVVVISIAWATLPWLLPTEFVKSKIVEDLACQLGTGVSIDSLKISWANGVEISGLRIDQPSDFARPEATGPMIEVEKITCDFSPATLLLDNRLEWMEITRPRIHAIVDSDGNINLAILKKLQAGPDARRISVCDADLSLQLPDHDRQLILAVSDLELSQGRFDQIGRVTMTASLEQNGARAPISLRLSTGQPDRKEAIDAAFHFANIDLSQIPLPRQQEFQLRELAGRCSGNLAFKISDNLQIKQLRLALQASNLKITHAGNKNLPVIEQAAVELSAGVESDSERINLASIRLYLPGLDIRGKAQIYSDILTDGFDAVENFDFQGQVQPTQLANLLTGLPKGKDPVECLGQIDVNILGQRDNTMFYITSTARGDDLIIKRHNDTIKPAGQKVFLELDATLQPFRNSWITNLKKCRLSLGPNHFSATATMVTPPQAGVNDDLGNSHDPLQRLMMNLKNIQARGTVEISHLGGLRNLLPEQDREKLHFDGFINGTWFLGGTKGPRFVASLRADSTTKFEFGKLFCKPIGREITFDVAFLADAEKMELDDLAVEVSVGNSWAGLDETTLQLPQPGRGLKITGDFEANGLEKILACMPVLSQKDIRLARSLDGFFSASLVDDKINLQCSADLRHLDIQAGDAFVKPSGKPMDLTLHMQGETGKWVLTSRMKTPHARFDAEFTHQIPTGEKPLTSVVLGGEIKDAGWLADVSPALARALKTARPQGKIKLAGRVKRSDDKLDFLLACDSDRLGLVDQNQPDRLSLHGEPFALNVRGHAQADENSVQKKIELALENVNLRFNNHRLICKDINVAIQPDALAKTTGQTQSSTRLKKLTGEFRISLALDDLQEETLLQNAEITLPQKMAGLLKMDCKVSLADEKLSLVVDADAKDVSISWPDKLTKAAGVPGRLACLVTADSDLSTLRVRNCIAQLGDIHFDGDAKIKIALDEAGLPVAIKPAESHFAIWSNRAETLGELFPEVKQYDPAGDFFVDLIWKGSADRERETSIGAISTVTFYARKLQGTYKERPVMIGGNVLLENVCLLKNGQAEIAGFHTDGLEFRAGKNHGWLLADIESVTDQPKGEFNALLEYLDVKDISDWLGGPGQKIPFNDERKRALISKAEDVIEDIRQAISGADIHGKISADTFGIFDENVRQHYMTEQFELDLTVDKGKIDLAYMTGVCGGLTRGRLSTNLADEKPSVTSHVEFADVISTPSIQPQIMMYFPGNTVSGTFSRDESITYPLRDMIANAMDIRYRIVPVGKAKMVATDGVVVGRAAPKFVTKVFTGLNLTKYPYQTMTGYSTFHADGLAENETFFFGAYDIYMEGTTDRENNVDYTLGVVLFGSTFSPEALRDWKQGRIPILKVKGRIENGKLVDETVSYPWPNQTLFEIFLKNNLVYRAWVNMNKKPRANPISLP